MRRVSVREVGVAWAALTALALTSAPILTSGCGGGGGNPSPAASKGTTGRAAFTVRWPERSRLIPFAADSIRVSIHRGDSVLGEALLTRPSNGGTATAHFERLPTGNTLVSAVAYPGSDGTGVAQAKADVGINIVGGQTTPVILTLASTIDRVEITPAVASLNVGASIQLSATAKNASGEIVLTSTSTVDWSTRNPAIATVEPGGLVRGVSVGTATIEARETESGKVGTSTFPVRGAPTPPPLGDISCHPGTGHCYEVVSAPGGISWSDARAGAEQRGGYLASITSAEENDFVFRLVDKPEFWRGSDPYSLGPWLGGYQEPGSPEPAGGWKWVSGEPFDYANWSSGNPNDQGDAQDNISYVTVGNGQRAATWDDNGGDTTIPPVAYVVEYAPAGTQVIYDNDFEGAAGSEWSSGALDVTPAGSRHFLGRFSNQTVGLHLDGLPTHRTVTVSFDLFFAGSWDGNVRINQPGNLVGPDIFRLADGNKGDELFRTTFSNWEPGTGGEDVRQAFPGTFPAGSFSGRTGAAENNTLGYPANAGYPNTVQDSVYRVSVTFPHTSATLQMNFGAEGLEEIGNESWGIDNVEVRVGP